MEPLSVAISITFVVFGTNPDPGPHCPLRDCFSPLCSTPGNLVDLELFAFGHPTVARVAALHSVDASFLPPPEVGTYVNITFNDWSAPVGALLVALVNDRDSRNWTLFRYEDTDTINCTGIGHSTPLTITEMESKVHSPVCDERVVCGDHFDSGGCGLINNCGWAGIVALAVRRIASSTKRRRHG